MGWLRLNTTLLVMIGIFNCVVLWLMGPNIALKYKHSRYPIPRVVVTHCIVFRHYLLSVGFSVQSVGMSAVWTSPVLVKLRHENQTVLPRPITEQEGSWIVSIAYLTCIFVFLISGYLLDKIGRKYCIILACIPRIIMFLIFTFASETWMLLLGRALSGVSDAMAIGSVATYNSEIASKEFRGAFGTIPQVLTTVGMLITLSVGPFVSYVSMNIIMTCITAAFTVPLFFMPETPFFLYKKGRYEEAVKVLTFLRGTEELAHHEIKSYSTSADTTVDKRKLFKDRTFLKTMGIVLFLSISVQMVGYSAVSSYLQTIFELSHTSVSSEISSVIIGAIQLFACVCTFLLTDRFGRKPVLTISLFGMAIGMLGLGSFFKVTENEAEISGFLNYLPLVSLILVLYCHYTGMGALLLVLVAELLDGPLRAFGLSTGLFVTSIFIFLTTNFFSPVITAIGPAATYWIFSANCVISCLFILFVVPETKGKTFAEIQRALGRRDLENKTLCIKL